jgi:aryl-alcohol dehydrogenase-like predicted oxidoreductase
MQRIFLGTVQFGLPYGRNYHKEIMSRSEVNKILDAAWDIGIRGFDTAEGYGLASSMLSEWIKAGNLSKQVSIINKISVTDVGDVKKILNAKIPFDKVENLTILTHGSVINKSWDFFRSSVIEMSAHPGQSVYSPEEAEFASQHGAHSVEAPYNVFDKKQFKAILGNVTKFYGRSIYLKGLFLDDPLVAERRVPGSGKIVKRLREFCSKHGIELSCALLATALNQLRPCDKVIIGVDDISQVMHLKHVFKISQTSLAKFNDEVAEMATEIVEHKTMLFPQMWN